MTPISPRHLTLTTMPAATATSYYVLGGLPTAPLDPVAKSLPNSLKGLFRGSHNQGDRFLAIAKNRPFIPDFQSFKKVADNISLPILTLNVYTPELVKFNGIFPLIELILPDCTKIPLSLRIP